MTQKEKVVKFWGTVGLLIFLSYLIDSSILIYLQMNQSSFASPEAYAATFCFHWRLSTVLLELSAVMLVASVVVNIFIPQRSFESNG